MRVSVSRIWTRTLFQVDRNAIFQICFYVLAINLACNPLVMERLLGSQRMEELAIRPFIGSFHAVSLVSIGLLLLRRNRPAVALRLGPTLLCFVLLTGSAEAFLRFALFSDLIEIPVLEYPSLYADPFSEDDFWVLNAYAAGSRYPLVRGNVDPVLGWPIPKDGAIPSTGGGPDGQQGLKKRPLLFFGDSFLAQLPGLIEPLLPQFTVLNYSVPGYATDQIVLRVEQTVPQFKEHQPLVVIGILLQDMDRSLQSFRSCQKPYFTMNEGVLEGPHLPLYQTNREFIDSYRFGWQPFLLRGIRGVARLALYRNHGTPEAREILNRELLKRLTMYLEQEQVSFRFVLFCNSYELEQLQNNTTPRRLQEVNAILAELDHSPFRTMDLFASREPLQDLYKPDGHHSVAADRRIARALAELVTAE